MTTLDPCRLGAVAARAAVAAGELSAVELTEAALRRIEALDHEIRAWEHVDGDLALAAARAAQAGPLHGVPFGIKDIFNTRHQPTAMGSVQWSDHAPGNDARVVFNARRAGAVALGKTVTAELAVHEPGATRNPHDLARSTGTSSSGSAAAVAAGMVPWALGSQSAGSIVRPASYCGVYGYKPSYGAIPRTGMLKATDTLDSVGVLARSPRDLRPLLEALRLHGADYPIAHATLDAPAPSALAVRAPRIAVLTDALGAPWAAAAADARAALLAFARRVEAAGAELVEAVLPAELAGAHATHATIYDRSLAYYFAAEAERRDELSAQLAALIDRGAGIPLAEYAAALDRQTAMRGAHADWAAGFDAVLTLSTAGTAPAHGDPDPIDSALIWTLCGAPAISVPALSGADGMPLGVQLVGRRWHDHVLLDVVDWLAARGLAPEAPLAGRAPARVPMLQR